MMYHTFLKINSEGLGYPIGTELEIASDKSGMPISKFWRRRLKDSEVDNCITVVKKNSSEIEEISEPVNTKSSGKNKK